MVGMRSLGLVCMTAASIALGNSLADAAEKAIVLEGKFGRVVSNTISKLDLKHRGAHLAHRSPGSP